MNRREVLKSTFGALALASGIAPAQNAIAQTRRRTALPAAGTPDYARLSNAVLDTHGHAAATVWHGTNTGTLKSDDLVKASLLLQLTTGHFDEIGVNAYLTTQLSKASSGTVSPSVVHAIGEQFRTYGISLTDAQIQSMYPADANARERGRLYLIQVGIPGVQLQIAGSFDLAAKRLRLQEIATACGALLPMLPLRSGLTPVAESCSDLQALIDAAETAFELATTTADAACLSLLPTCEALEAIAVAIGVALATWEAEFALLCT